MNEHFALSDFYFRALIRGQSYEIDSHGELIKRPAASTRLQISNLPPLYLPTAINNYLYARIVNIEGMRKFFGTLERNRLLLDDLQRMLDAVEPTDPGRVFDPAPGEIVLVKHGGKFVRGCVVRKAHFMTCTAYLIDSGITMEVGLEQLYVINEKLLKIPPQAFLMLLDADVDHPVLSKDELNVLLKDTVVGFRLKNISENGEAFVGVIDVQNKAGEICNLRSILQGRGIQSMGDFQDDDKSVSQESSSSISSTGRCSISTQTELKSCCDIQSSQSDRLPINANAEDCICVENMQQNVNRSDNWNVQPTAADIAKHAFGDSEDDYFTVSQYSDSAQDVGLETVDKRHADSQKFVSELEGALWKMGEVMNPNIGCHNKSCWEKKENATSVNDELLIEKRLISVGNNLRGMRLQTESSGPGFFYMHFLDDADGFEDIRTYSSHLFGKYDHMWHKLRVISDVRHDTEGQEEFAHVGSIVGSATALCFGCEQMDVELRSRYKAAFACRLAYSAPKPFNDNVYSGEAKSYFTTNLMTNVYFDVHVVGVSRRNIVEVEIFMPDGVSLFDKLCEFGFAQRRWAWKPPLYHFSSLNEQQILRRSDDEDDVHLTFTVQAERRRNDLLEFQKYLKRSERVLRNPEVGDICIVECEGQLFRGEVVDKVDNERTFIVRYVDYGDEQELNGDALYAIECKEEFIMETPVFGIICRLEGIRPFCNGLDKQTGAWSRKALKLINRAIPLNKQFSAFIGQPEADGVCPIRVVGEGKLFSGCNDLAATLVHNKLAMYEPCKDYSVFGNLSVIGRHEVQYLNVEGSIIYGIPDVFEAWFADCQNYLEMVGLDVTIANNGETKGLVFYENRYRRALVLQSKEKGTKEMLYFLVDEGRTIQMNSDNDDNEKPALISFCTLKNLQAAFFLRTCPALAVGFCLKDLTFEVTKYLREVFSGTENSRFSVCITDKLKNGIHCVDDITFMDGRSLVSALSSSSLEAFAYEPPHENSYSSEGTVGDQKGNDNESCSERFEFFSTVDLFKKQDEIAESNDEYDTLLDIPLVQ